MRDYKSATLTTYDLTAKEYQHNTKLLHPQIYAQKFMQRVLAGGRILDLGCGPGRDAKIFQEQGFKVVGIDFSSKMIELARKMVPQGEFHLMDIESLHFPKEHFDGIWASSSLLHIPKQNILAIFKRIFFCLKEEAIFYLSVKEGDGESLEKDKRYGDGEKFWSFFQQEELLAMLVQAQFTLLEIECTLPCSSYQTHSILHLFAKKERLK